MLMQDQASARSLGAPAGTRAIFLSNGGVHVTCPSLPKGFNLTTIFAFVWSSS
jgi:hypothetical protein